jgi:hydrogenase expression/formation protein HypE
VGVVPEGVDISVAHALPKDVVILSGTIGDHGVTVLSQRQSLHFKSPVASDVAPLNRLVRSMLDAAPAVHAMRDPTRGGVATTLKEIAASSSVGIAIEEERIPVSEAVKAACEMLGLDCLYLANEGKLVAVVPEADAMRVLEAMRGNAYGKNAAVIGRVTEDHPGMVTIRNVYGIERIVEMLASDQFPRIC